MFLRVHFHLEGFAATFWWRGLGCVNVFTVVVRATFAALFLVF
jgi:hypothetical protein